jgi:wyosine [tRNA(Phe)-imidazoG37] synthetase (radical SAM superfamily)
MNVGKKSVFEALTKIDNPVLKLDSAFDDTVRFIDRPNSPDYSVAKQVELYRKFEGNFILQTMFLKGEFEGTQIDNTTEREVSAWLELVDALRPREVMIYTIDRETPAGRLKKAPVETLNAIAKKVQQLGIATNVAG